jgi:hypothetical protein
VTASSKDSSTVQLYFLDNGHTFRQLLVALACYLSECFAFGADMVRPVVTDGGTNRVFLRTLRSGDRLDRGDGAGNLRRRRDHGRGAGDHEQQTMRKSSRSAHTACEKRSKKCSVTRMLQIAVHRPKRSRSKQTRMPGSTAHPFCGTFQAIWHQVRHQFRGAITDVRRQVPKPGIR